MGAAFCAGTLDAIAGGGGLITLPALLAAGLPPTAALGTNKGQSIWGTAAALATFARKRLIRWQVAVVAFGLGACGAAAGAMLVVQLDPSRLRLLVVVLLGLASITVLLRRPNTPEGLRPSTVAARFAVIALALGLYDGFFGPGTGTFLVIALMMWGGLGALGATAHAKAVNLGSNAAALAVFAIAGDVVWDVALPMALAQIVGGTIGAKIAVTRGASVVRSAILVVALALMIRVIGQAAGAW